MTPAYVQLADDLRARILAGELTEGERLPSETALASQAGVSRSTVREALRTLQEGGFVERPSPRMMVVRPLGPDPAARPLAEALRRRRATFAHLCEALQVLEPELIALAARRATARDLSRLRQSLDAQEAVVADVDAFSALDTDFHLQIAAIAANPALTLARAPLSELLLPAALRLMRTPEMTAYALRYHRRMVEEIEAGDGDTAAALSRRHVRDFRVSWERAGFDPDAPIDASTR